MTKVIKTNLAELRFKHGRISQKKVSEATGIGQKTLSALETSASKGIEFNTLLRLCEFFNCNPGDLLQICDEKDTSEVDEVVISEASLVRAKQLVAQGLERALHSEPSSADDIWNAFDTIREKIQSEIVRKQQERTSA
jgi:putative transcriptional regulator